MTLKDKFEMTMISFLIEKKQDATMLDHFQKIADDYAIGFAEWYLKVSEKYDSYLKLQYESKELLEIYKKEKGL